MVARDRIAVAVLQMTLNLTTASEHVLPHCE